LTRRFRLLSWLERATRDRTWSPPEVSAWDEDGNAHAVWERDVAPRAPWAVVVGCLLLLLVLLGFGALVQLLTDGW